MISTIDLIHYVKELRETLKGLDCDSPSSKEINKTIVFLAQEIVKSIENRRK